MKAGGLFPAFVVTFCWRNKCSPHFLLRRFEASASANGCRLLPIADPLIRTSRGVLGLQVR